MMKIVILGLLAAMASAAPPMGMPPMMMPNMMMPGPRGLASMLSGGIPPEALELMKNLKPDDIKNAITNMPPEMREMINGMGISQEQLSDAVDNLPEDITPLLNNVEAQLGNLQNNENVEMPEEMKESALNQLKGQMQEMGMDIKDDEDLESVMRKVRLTIKQQLKDDGYDMDDPEAFQARVMAEMRKATNAKPDESDDEVKATLATNMLQQMKDNGIDVDPKHPEEALETVKGELKKKLKSLDVELDEDDLDDLENLPSIVNKLIMSGKLGNPLHVMMSAMATVSSGEQNQPPQMMMMPPQMAQMGPGPNMMPPPLRQYVSGAEDALIHVFGGEDDVVRNLMEVREGAMRGAIPEGALFGLMQDLLHYRLEARVLLAQNRMLEEKLAFSQGYDSPPFTSMRVLGCAHMH